MPRVKESDIPEWLTLEETCRLMNRAEKTIKDKCRHAELTYRIEKKSAKYIYFISFKSLPIHYQNLYLGIKRWGDRTYSDVPSWAKVQAEKYLTHIDATVGIKGNELKKYIENWNKENPNEKTSYSCLMKMKNRYNESGVSGLLAKYGKNAYRTIVTDELYEYFKNLYLKEGCPSARSCWDITLGYAMGQDPTVNRDNFPSMKAFLRRLEVEIPSAAVYLARNGKTAWNRKYACYIERDYSTITSGQVWVSDHAQLDVACVDDDGKIVFPWVTAWRDYKSSKWLGWSLHMESPNSDHIFQSFYYAAKRYGLPDDVIIDNGKDYRCKDFAGGRPQTIKINVNQAKTRTMLDELGVKVHYALPYNAQTKPIERDFLKIKELLTKHCKGYRGGNVVERPDVLIKEIKQGKIMHFDDFKKIFNNFILRILNRRPSEGKNLNGKCPDQLFYEEFKTKNYVKQDALKLFCMRTSRNFTIGRNGIQDRQLGITYWADWLISETGLKVYLRRDPKNYKEAWVFKADNDAFVGTVTAVEAVAALHAETVSKEEFKTAMAIKKRNLKIAESYIMHSREIDITERCENYMRAYSQVIKKSKPSVTLIKNTKMDQAVLKKKEMDEFGKQDLSEFLAIPLPEPEPQFYYFETDKRLAEEEAEYLKGAVANG